ncbi:hypothetical protein CYLTODRAFT_408064 [Cylindrobasidium torrendii FP15055 ss-10]|uniref:Thioredoxin domain-containing protein n=1 Tax=Cylindrobasidium torrendii FP15055 ss-10 TaxID=1314674 RepID=A0A0D7BLU9_9AGAR|nr:hypothetical protein CYLTODRAFT_408064 [Cylindrobasidium torrendii FP15055 ss-10]
MVNAEELRGRIAPSFELIDHEGRPFKFVPGTLGARLVIFFFVGPGATITTYQVARMMQLYDSKLRGSQNQADESRLQVVGVCTAKVELLAHQARARGLRYPLISDPDAAVARGFGVGSMVDKWFTKRASFVIDEDGKVE